LLPAAAVLVACWPLLADGFPKGHDWSLELVRIAEYRNALADGPLPPAWAGDVYGGFGSPVFVYYAPLFAMAAAALAELFGSVESGAIATLVALTAVSAVAVQRLVRAVDGGADAPAPRVAAYALVLNPYLLGDKFLRNANAEFAALCLAPIAIHGLLLLRSRRRSAVALLAGGLALAVLAHNLTALVVLVLLLGGAALLERPRPPPRVWAGLAGALALGLSLSAFFWIPALAYQPLMRAEEILIGKFDFHRQFASLGTAFGYGRFYASGLLPPALCAAALVAALRAGATRERRVLVGCLLAAVGFTFLTTSASTPVWETIPWLPLFQFPWRMLGPFALVTAIAAGVAFAVLLRGRSTRLRIGAELVLLALCLANALPALLAAEPLAPPVRARLEHRLQRETIRSQHLGVTVLDEYLPRGADPAAWRNPSFAVPPVLAGEPAARISVIEEGATRILLEVETEAATRLRVARWSFPGWRLRLNGDEVELGTAPDGTLALGLPPGRHRAELEFRGPPLRRALLPLSGAALVAWLVVACGRPRRWWPTPPDPPSAPRRSPQRAASPSSQ
jgi:hypothetical protein